MPIYDPRPGAARPGTDPMVGPVAGDATSGLDLESIRSILGGIAGGDETLTRGLTGGLDLGQALYSPGTLGRLEETTPENQAIRRGITGLIRNRNKELALASRKRQERLEGFTPEQRQVFRDEGIEGINRSVQGAMRAARGASLGSGVMGGINAIPMQNIIREGALARRGLERDIIRENLAERERQLQGLQSVGRDRFGEQMGKTKTALAASQQVTNDELNRRLFNLNQFAKERQGQLGLLFGTAGLTTQREGQLEANRLANRQLDIAEKFGFGGGFGPGYRPNPNVQGTPGTPEFNQGVRAGQANLNTVASQYFNPDGTINYDYFG